VLMPEMRLARPRRLTKKGEAGNGTSFLHFAVISGFKGVLDTPECWAGLLSCPAYLLESIGAETQLALH